LQANNALSQDWERDRVRVAKAYALSFQQGAGNWKRKIIFGCIGKCWISGGLKRRPRSFI
jgi:hypothetical protein